MESRKPNKSLNQHIQVIILWLLKLSAAVSILIGLLKEDWELFSISALALVLMFSPIVVSKKYKVKIPIEFDFIIGIFIFAGVALGEIGRAYDNFWWWDVVLHITSGLILAFAGFLVLYVLIAQEKIKTSPFLIAFLTFCVGLAMGTAWEIFEFAVDQFFGTNLQKSGLIDTMWDLIVDAVGSLAVATAAYYYLKDQRQGLVAGLVEKFMKLNPQILRSKK